MKTLTLILLIFYINMQGQEYVTLNNDDTISYGYITPCLDKWVEYQEHKWFNCRQSKSIDSTIHYIAIESIINLYSEYEKECSKDTIFGRLNTKPYSECKCLTLCEAQSAVEEYTDEEYFIKQVDINCYEVQFIYKIGREANPDKHFIAWLRKKYNQ